MYKTGCGKWYPGPNLFVVLINEVLDAVARTSMTFADDTNIFCSISNDKDAAQPQQDLNNLIAEIYC